MATSTINNPNIYTKVWTVNLDSVSSANGAYSHNTTVPKMTTDYKPILFECDDPSIFKDTVNVSTGQNTVTLSCNNAIGSTTGVKASFVLQGDVDTLSSAEYQALGSRIGDLNNLNTNTKNSVVGAINEVNNNIPYIFTLTYTISSSNTWYRLNMPNELTGSEVAVIGFRFETNTESQVIYSNRFGQSDQVEFYSFPTSNEMQALCRNRTGKLIVIIMKTE